MSGSTSLRWRRCQAWAEGPEHGGPATDDTWQCTIPGKTFESTILSGREREIFDDVSVAEQTAGDSSAATYRKIYLENINIVPFAPIIWFDPGAVPLEIRAGGTASRAGVPTRLAGICDIDGTSVTGTGTSFLSEVVSGEMFLHYDTDAGMDTAHNTPIAEVISDTELVLDDPYPLTLAAVGPAVGPITAAAFTKPTTVEAGVRVAGVPVGGMIALWLRRTIPAGGYIADSCRLRCING